MKNARNLHRTCLIGIDLGGTNIKAGVVSLTGKVLLRKSVPTCTDAGKKAVIARIAAAGIELAAWARSKGIEPRAMGVGSPGQLDSVRGIVFFSPNFPDWRNVPLKGELEKLTCMRTFIENDANAAAWGEKWAGAGRKVRSFVLYTLGTGIGGGIVLDGRLWRGANGMGGELGHVIVQPNGRKCGCGDLGCVEAHSSAGAVAREFAARKWLPPETMGSREVFDAAAAGDKDAAAVIEDAARYLGIAIAGIVNALNPEMILLGGGMAKAGGAFIAAVRRHVSRHALKASMRGLKIAKAALGDDAGIVGAAGIALVGVEAGQPPAGRFQKGH